MLTDVQGVSLRTFVPEDAPKMVALQRRCLEICPDISLLPEGFYHAPGFAGGRNILCALDASGAHIGHGMVLPSFIHARLDAWMLWMDLRVDPDLANWEALMDLLLERIGWRANEMQRELDRPVMLYATYFEHGSASIAYLKSRGFEHFESCYQMRRDLSVPIPEVPEPEGVEMRAWRMETEPEQRRYLAAYAAAFGKDDRSLEDLQHFMRSQSWSDGTTFTAFDGDEVVGSVMAYYDPDPVANPERAGSTEYVFVRPEWRRRGIARHLLGRSLRYLKERDLAYAFLEVLAENAKALTLYEAMGYERLRREVSLGIWLDKGDAMRPYLGACKFGASCRHDSEPGCAIKDAVDNGDISEARYHSYLRLARELD